MTVEKFCDKYGLGNMDRFVVCKMLKGADLPEEELKVQVVQKCNIAVLNIPTDKSKPISKKASDSQPK